MPSEKSPKKPAIINLLKVQTADNKPHQQLQLQQMSPRPLPSIFTYQDENDCGYGPDSRLTTLKQAQQAQAAAIAQGQI